ncbi:MAG: hypothetical protein EOL88_12895 [Bacteroidia bacterium]|nr:hypothetical protein [Bacteroidia bacterium]
MKNYVLLKDNEVVARYTAETKPVMNASKGIVYEAVTATPPTITSSQKLIESWSFSYGKYKQSWQVVEKTLADTWHFEDYSMRIKIPLTTINSNLDVQEFVSKLIMWWNLTGLSHTADAENSYFYCNFIYPEHQAIVDAFQGLITIENLNQ